MSNQPHILVIEDNIIFRELASEMLKGYPLSTAETGAQGLKLFKQHAPEIVFLDITLPDIDGHQLLQELMQRNKELYVVMLTGSRLAEDVKKSIGLGAKGYILKPFTQEQIDTYLVRYQEQLTEIRNGT